MKEEFQFTCKFCNTVRHSEWTPNTIMPLETWKDKLCCDRCGKYHMSRILTTESIVRMCVVISQSRQLQNKSKSEEIVAVCRDKLVTLTKKLASLLSNHAGVANVWNIEFVDNLVYEPEKAWKFVKFYVENFRKF